MKKYYEHAHDLDKLVNNRNKLDEHLNQIEEEIHKKVQELIMAGMKDQALEDVLVSGGILKFIFKSAPSLCICAEKGKLIYS